MTRSVALPKLAEWLGTELSRDGEGNTVVLAGHYAIFSAGATAVDFLGPDRASPVASAELLAFTKFTWNAACEAIAAAPDATARLLVLVDDMTFVRPVLDDTSARERLSDALASGYLRALPRLPAYHAERLAAHALGAGHVAAQAEARWVYSERELRAAHVRRLKALVRSGSMSDRLSTNSDENYIAVTLKEHGEHCLVHSGHTNCAGGYLELLATLHAQGVERLISLVPMRCVGPITVGTALAHELFGLDELSVVNVAIPDITSDLPAAILDRTSVPAARSRTA